MGNSAVKQQGKLQRTKGAKELPAVTERQQRLRLKSSVWSLDILSYYLNGSFTSANRKSNQHCKSSIKGLTIEQQRQARTAWHKPLTNAIFSTHFKETRRNEQLHIETLIAKGAFGVVFKVTDKQTQHQKQQQIQQKKATSYAHYYALKVLKKSKIIEENCVQQTKNEADIQRVCGHHPFIVQQFDLWQTRRNLFILLEFVPNGEIFSKIAHFSIDLVRLYLGEIALALDFLHNAGVIYRDAKPENILLTQNYHIKLVDFGLSKWLKLGAFTKTMCGTFQYMAPEILCGEAYGHAVDWWSLGIIGCEMLTQKIPDMNKFLRLTLSKEKLENTTVSNSLRSRAQNINGNISCLNLECTSFFPTEVQSLPHEAKDILMRLLQIDPKQRLRSVLAMQKIALYQNFKITSKYFLNINPLEILSRDNIKRCEDQFFNESSRDIATTAFEGF